MKGAVLLLSKNGVTIRTTYTTQQKLQWFDGEITRGEIESLGFKVIDDKVTDVLHKLHEMREASAYGRKITGPDLLYLIRILEDA